MLPVPSPGAEPATSWHRELRSTLAAAGIVVLFCAALLAWDPGYFWIDDSQSGAMPAYCEMARAWRAGEIPLLNRCSWRAGAPGCEYPAGVFSPTLAGCILLVFSTDLPLPLAAAVISIFHLAVLAAGAFRVARQRGLATDLALLVALIASLNGWIILWGARGWGVCLYSFAWLPWAWWGLVHAQAPPHGWIRFVPAGLLLALLIAAGWPLTVLMAGLVTLWLAAQTWAQGSPVRTLWPSVAAWAVGLGLSAPAWLMLLDYVPQTTRGQTNPLQLDNAWLVPWSSLPALLFPGLVDVWNVYGFWKLHQCAELCGGLVPLAILAACLRRDWRSCLYRHRWDWGLLALALFLATGPALGNFRWSFRWLPLFFLVLGLLAAEALATLRAQSNGPGVPSFAIWAFLGLFAVWLRALAVRADPTGITVGLGLTMLLLCYLWLVIEQRLEPASPWRSWLPAGVVLLSCWLTYASSEMFCEVPRWQFDESIRESAPLDRNVRYISIHAEADVIDTSFYRTLGRAQGKGETLYLGNTPMYAGVEFINGYSPFGPRGLEEIFQFGLHGWLYPEGAERILEAETADDGLLAQLGVDGLVLADRFAAHRPVLIANGWQEIARVDGATVLHRTGSRSARVRAIAFAEVVAHRADALDRLRQHKKDTPVPAVLLDETQSHAPGTYHFRAAQVTLVEDGRHRAVAQVRSEPGDGEALIVFSRPWFPGYAAVCAGQPLPVEVCNGILPAVRVPAGTDGMVVLQYQPGAFVIGSRTAGATALVVTGALLVFSGQRLLRRRGTARRAPDQQPFIATSPERAAHV